MLRGGRSTLPRKIKGGKNGVHLVEVHKGPIGLGLQLQGSMDASTPIKVKAVLSGGPAFKTGKIQVGNEIIEVNRISFESLSQQDAVKVMKELPQGKVSIILRDHEPELEDNEETEFNVAEMKEPEMLADLEFEEFIMEESEMLAKTEFEKNTETEFKVAETKKEPETSTFEEFIVKKSEEEPKTLPETDMSIEETAADEFSGSWSKETDDMRSSYCNTQSELVLEEKMIIDLLRHSTERLGIRLVGGRDNPNLTSVHVSRHITM